MDVENGLNLLCLVAGLDQLMRDMFVNIPQKQVCISFYCLFWITLTCGILCWGWCEVERGGCDKCVANFSV